jgi:signal transduction histidine kinase
MTVKAIGELANLVADLRPSLLDDMGLHAALGWYIQQINQRGSMQVELKIKGMPARISPEVEITLFRIAQEALANVVRHAQATQAQVELSYKDGDAKLQISDDGIGFDSATVLEGETQLGWGLVGIRERAQMAGGTCHIESAPGEGTTVSVEIPLQAWEDRDNGAD